MLNSVRHLVSKKKRRYIKDGFDLDLTYITDRIIAMGFPSEGLEADYRNPMEDVQKFFDHYHADHFKIYNLCSERSYAPKSFDNSVAAYPFDDHNAPRLGLIEEFCKDVVQYLDKDPKNVVAIHCKAGKGRTGTLICCLLMHMGMKKTAKESLDFFGTQRTKNGKGVTIPSQRRYVQYYEWLLKNFLQCDPPKPFDYAGRTLTLQKFVLSPVADFDVGGGCDPYVKMYNPKGDCLYNSKKQGPKVVSWRKDPQFVLEISLEVKGDVKVVFWDEDSLSKDDKMFQFWFHTNMVKGGHLKMSKMELDGAHKDKKSEHFKSDFTCEVFFKETDDDDDEIPPPPPPLVHDEKTDVDEDIDYDVVEYSWACRQHGVPPPPRAESPPPPPPPTDAKAQPSAASAQPTQAAAGGGKCTKCKCDKFVANLWKPKQCRECSCPADAHQ